MTDRETACLFLNAAWKEQFDFYQDAITRSILTADEFGFCNGLFWDKIEEIDLGIFYKFFINFAF